MRMFVDSPNRLERPIRCVDIVARVANGWSNNITNPSDDDCYFVLDGIIHLYIISNGIAWALAWHDAMYYHEVFKHTCMLSIGDKQTIDEAIKSYLDGKQ